ncbi:MAG TPA: ribose-5-phosphate isomerase RpiA [Egicoccus sp.]|nr:ribose-5-phosphate isomerase RpiA [Egicoccus sp.]HSK24356.1 ribose-5-phosphate isomerase RpiA [Egicoccus sp.]
MSDAKRAAGEAAAELVEDGMRLGLGTGSTVAFFLDALAARGLDVAGVPTSEATAARCRELGIRLLDVATTTDLDLAVDGADELDHDLQLVKGGGGALLREKVVESLAARFVVIATADKLVDRLADTFPLPIEVVPFAVGPVRRRLETLGFEVALRGGDTPYVTDNGNHVLDGRLPGGIEDPDVMDVELALVPGIAGHGLFVDMATEALLGDGDGGVRHLTRPAGEV